PSINDPGERKYFVAIREDHIEAFVVCTPVHARNGVYFDLMRRREKPLSGTAQFLIAESFRLLGEQGYEMATLGTAPLANEHVEDHDQSRFIALAMEVTFNYLGYFHRYKPLYQFKEQFGPSSWEARYLAYWPPRFHPGILYALLKAYDPTGVSGKARRQLRLVWQGIRWLGQTPKELLDKIIQR
ncbi:MAG: phosphatidylglycerol lysyltransferase domain-containing protein, partial [Chloroflexi bacterium]|nr:phosphatidylglycerol lysyltransferase domain-containing protein [Chloroflexota bacterium]